MSSATVLAPSDPICVHESEVASATYTGRTGYDSPSFLEVVDPDRGIDVNLVSVRPSRDFYTPRHRHGTTHVRYYLGGITNYGRESYGPGDCLVIPDGVPYGPMRSSPDSPLDEQHHLLQTTFMGPSGIPRGTQEERARARAELLEKGVFENGVYRPFEGRPQDSGEAVMEQLLGAEYAYPTPRVHDYLAVDTNQLPWRAHAPGVALRHVASLFDVGPVVTMIRLDEGAVLPPGKSAYQQARYVIAGTMGWRGRDFAPVSLMYLPPATPYPEIRGLEDATTILSIAWANPGDDLPTWWTP